MTLWDFLQSKCILYDFKANEYYIYKRKGVKGKGNNNDVAGGTGDCYIQMRSTLIDNGRKVIIFLNDITKIKEL